MLEKLDSIEVKYEEIGRELSDPDVILDQDKYRRLAKAHSDLEEIVSKYREYKKAMEEADGLRSMLKERLNDELHEMALEELQGLEAKMEELRENLKILLLPKDPNDEKNVIVEIRAGTGGEEAALFAGDLFRMYNRYAERNNWSVEVMSDTPTGLGGFKEIIFSVEGQGVYSRLKYESGAHRVQRVPETESSGRIHTSAATVAVLPEAEEIDVEINPNDLRIDVYRSQGHGGQSVNTTDSAVRITHIPTGVVVACQDEKSQLKNKVKAMKILRARLLDKLVTEQQEKMAKERRSQVGTGDRSERIRTYNFPQGRVTDHRVNLTLYKLESFLDGDIDEIIDALITTEQAERLKQTEG